MTIGKIKLSYSGKKDLVLIGNPQISFWKYAYKRYTNFSMQSIEIENDGYMDLQETTETKIRFKIPRNADLVNFITLRLNLPEIYSQIGNNGEFKWIDNIGSSIIKYARLYFDSNLIEEINGEYLYIYNKLFSTHDEENNYNKLTGHIPDLYKPYNDGTYREYIDNETTIDDSDNDIYYLNKNYNNVPSIPKYTLNIPLLFGFFRTGQHIPLISCKKNEIFIEILFRPLRDLYTIANSSILELYKPSYSLHNIASNIVDNSANNIDNNVYYRKRFKDMSQGFFSEYTKNITNSYFNPRLEINYVFLDNDERNLISLNSYPQVLSFIKRIEYKDLFENSKINIDVFHPIKSIILVPKKIMYIIQILGLILLI